MRSGVRIPLPAPDLRASCKSEPISYNLPYMAKHKVIIPVGLKPSPARYELSAAEILASYFKADVEFIDRSNYKTPDFLINNITWELKCPTGKVKHNIEHQMKAGTNQSGKCNTRCQTLQIAYI
jgi:hypothetical protein